MNLRREQIPRPVEGQELLVREERLDRAPDPRPMLDLSGDGAVGRLGLLPGFRSRRPPEPEPRAGDATDFDHVAVGQHPPLHVELRHDPW